VRSAAKRLGVSGLARAIGASESTVRRWVKNGPSKKGAERVRVFLEGEKGLRGRRREDEALIALLMKQSGEVGRLPSIKTKEGVRAGPQTSGYFWQKRFGNRLSVELVRSIEAWMIGKRGSRRFPLWQATATLSEYGPGRFGGKYPGKARLLSKGELGTSLDHVIANFTPEEHLATRRSKSLSVVIDELSKELQEILETGNVAFLHGVRIVNYRFRSEEERMSWQTGKRQQKQRRRKRKRGGKR
jgi:hypothetical protein